MPDRDMWVPSMDAVLSHWCPTYLEAKSYLEAHGGFLFPYREQFFVTSAEGVRELGLDPDDVDWSLIGFDWVEPADQEAWERLRLQRSTAG